MGLSKKQEKEILQVYDTWMHSYLNGDVKTYDSYLDANYHFIGSTSNEEFLNKEATTHFFKTTADQLAGKTEIRNSVKTIEEIDGLIFITDLFDAYFLNNNDWTYYGRFRFTSALHKNKDGWRFVYQHFSMPDSKAEEGETIGYEQISLENLQLREAIKRRTVELEHKNKELAIEAALERVRARTMAMQKSEELAETSSLLFQQLKVLGINTYSSGFTIWDKAQNELISWMCNADGSINPPFRMPLTENTWHFDQYKNWKEGKEFALKDFTGEEMKSHFRYLQSFPLLDEAFKKSIAAGHPMPKRQVHHVANFSQGNLLFITLEPRPEAHDVFKRFAKVFEQTYTRFLDLQKAEEQAREANVEASLERVRSRSMAMHKTSELQEVIHTVHKELLHLNISIYGGSFIAINKDIQDEIRCWGSGGTANTSEEVHIPLFEKPFYTNLIKGIKKGPGFFTEEYTQKEKKEFFTHLFKHQPWSELSSEEKKETLASPGGYTRSCCVSKCTSIFIINHSGRKFTEAENEVLKRFAKVFEQTYTRFLDLQKAEAQAREAQIEAALEKVRSCSLAMHATEELQKVVTVVFEKMTELNIELDTININIFKAGSKEANLWTAAPNQKYATPFHLPFFDHPFHTDIFEAKEQGVDLFAKVYTFEEKNSYFNHTFLHSDFKHVPEEKKKIILEGKVCARSIAFTKDVAILLHRYYDTPFSDAENEILKRFTNVFQQAYTRFLDLQKAEAQAREAQIEAALERVRSRTMAMQKSDELHDTAKLLFQQIKSLGVPPWSCGFNIWEQGDKIFTSYMGGSEGTILAAFKIPLTEEAAFIHFQESRDRGDKLFADVLEGDAIKKHYEYFTSLPGIKEVFEARAKAGFPLPTFQINHLANFSNGNLLFITYEPCPEAHDIFIRFAKVFEQTYTRFLDLQKAETQARESEIELALERVRARTMAMQHSDELQEAAVLMFQQIENLGVPVFGCGFNIWDEDRKAATSWMAGKDRLQPSFKTSSSKDIFSRIHAAAQKGESLFVEEQAGRELKAHYKYMGSIPEFKEVIEKMATTGVSLPKFQIMHCAFFSQGYLMFITHEPCPEAYDIFKRFAKVFEQTYTRFLDLQKAEAQAREAQIELALERVRARTMAMQHSDELQETAELLFQQIKNLGIETWSCGFSLWYDHDSYFMGYNTGPDGKVGDPLKIPLTEDIFFKTIRKGKKEGKELLVFESEGESLRDTYRYMDKLPDVGDFMRGIVHAGFELPKYQVTHCGYFSHGHLMFITLNPQPDNWDIFKRFTKVFQQTYTRFLDLQKAETQAREAQIELGLERVRARAMAMQESNELSDLVGTLLSELTKLDFSLTFCIINIINESDNSNMVWAANPEEGKAPESYYMRFEDYPFHDAMMKEWKAQTPKFIYVMEGREKEIYDNYLYSETEFRRFPIEVQMANRALDKYVATFVFSQFGGLQTVGDKSLSEENMDILYRFGKVFDLTYTRFNDLQKAETQAREAQIELALERVRARTMAMQKSDELRESVLVIYEQLQLLDFDANACNIIIMDKESRYMQYWVSGFTQEIYPESYLVPNLNHRYLKAQFDAWDKGEKYIVIEYSGKTKQSFDELFFTQTDFKNVPEQAKQFMRSLESVTLSTAYLSYGALQILGTKALSTDNAKILQRFAKVFEQTYTRFLDLQKAEAQARESEIELALERVRSRSMAMQKSEELKEVIQLVYEQFVHLNIRIDHAGFVVDYIPKGDWHFWIADQHEIPSKITHPYFDSVWANQFDEAKEKGIDFFATNLNFEEKNKFYQGLLNLIPGLSEEVKEFYFSCPGLAGSTVLLDNVGLYIENFDGIPYTDEENNTLMRFGKVFQQTYTRFLDLQKAEAQARESQIELGLERVRARAMAMHNSNELAELVATLFRELIVLDMGLTSCIIWIHDFEKNKDELWVASNEINKPAEPFYIHPFHEGFFTSIVHAWKAKDKQWTFKLKGKDKHKFQEAFFREVPNLPVGLKSVLEDNDKVFFSASFNRYGALEIVSNEELSEKSFNLLHRFGKVFNSTYTRFLDLQKAEAQARESKIEAALERLRSRSMAMHKSEELADLSFELVKQVQGLGVPTWFCAFNIYDDDEKSSWEWGSNAEGTFPKYRTPREGIFLRYYEAGQSGETLLINEIGEKECPAHYDYLCSLPGVGDQLRKMRDAGIPFPTSQIDHVAYFKYGYIIFITFEPAPEAHDIFKRFAKVFEQTYTRFLDLQKAEEQARIAVKQASLDRVRGEIASMRSAQDLERITPLVWNELNILGIPFIRCGVFIIHEKKENVEVYLSSSKGQSLAVLHLPFGSNDLTIQSVDAWRKGKVYIQHWNKEDFLNWSKSMMDKGQIQDQETYQGADAPPESLDLHFVPFTQGMLYVGSPYSLSEEEIDLVKSLAGAFEIAYARYEDFVKLEKAKESIEVTLNELKATQAQLIQSEKLASLGQLTAGIAHEIKNPLNFVNNFSDLSIDLIEEVFEELDKTKDHENNEEIRELLTVVKSNLEKIYQHGSRADGIVKSMLQHSRGGSGKMEPTDLNVLVKEYVTLAFHGMRASKNPINVSLKFDLDEQLSPVKLISEDFSRVVLNLCNNAFDAMREKLKKFEEKSTKNDVAGKERKSYLPKLTVSTKLEKGQARLCIEDNGPGIPDEIKDKILQPFFTTKKGTEGTGLGLSITHDIVKAHGGELKVETREDEGSEFIISLPV